METNTNTEAETNQENSQQGRKRTGSQFSIDELLRQDDKRGKFESDSKSISVDEVDDNEQTNDEAVRVKLESNSPGTEKSQ